MPLSSFKKLEPESKFFSKILKLEHEGKQTILKFSKAQYEQVITLFNRYNL